MRCFRLRSYVICHLLAIVQDRGVGFAENSQRRVDEKPKAWPTLDHCYYCLVFSPPSLSDSLTHPPKQQRSISPRERDSRRQIAPSIPSKPPLAPPPGASAPELGFPIPPAASAEVHVGARGPPDPGGLTRIRRTGRAGGGPWRPRRSSSSRSSSSSPSSDGSSSRKPSSPTTPAQRWNPVVLGSGLSGLRLAGGIRAFGSEHHEATQCLVTVGLSVN
jgi:hypothetical protein